MVGPVNPDKPKPKLEKPPYAIGAYLGGKEPKVETGLTFADGWKFGWGFGLSFGLVMLVILPLLLSIVGCAGLMITGYSLSSLLGG